MTLVFPLVRPCSVALVLAMSAMAAQASPASEAVQTRYRSDLKLCADEPNATARLQCRRDAKAERDQALVQLRTPGAPPPLPAPAPVAPPGAVIYSTPPDATPGTLFGSPAPAAPACADCARVLAVSITQKAGEAGAAGVIAGGAIGAVLGNQVGGGVGKDLATIAGAVGGAYAGRAIEERMHTRTVWTVSVVYPDERRAQYEFLSDPGLKVGDRVRAVGSSLARY